MPGWHISSGGGGGGGTGDVVGPAGATANDLVAFDGATGKLLKDTGILYTDVVVGPASATDLAFARFDGATGKLIQNGVLTSADHNGDLTGPSSASDTTAAGSAFTNQPASDSVTIVSDNAGDTTQTATVIGTTDGTDTVVVEDIALNGIVPVVTVKVNWGVILAVKLSAAAAGTVTFKETSGGLTITTLAPAATSKGVDSASLSAWNRTVSLVGSGATTKQIGLKGTDSAGVTIYDSQALTGTTAVLSNSGFVTITEIYIGDLEGTRTCTVSTTGGTKLLTSDWILSSSNQLSWTDAGLARSAAGLVKITDGSTGLGGLVIKDDFGSGKAALNFGGTGATDGGLVWASSKLQVLNGSRAAYKPIEAEFFSVGGNSKYVDTAIYNSASSALSSFRFLKKVEANTAGAGSPHVLQWYEVGGNVWTNEGSTAKNYHTLPTAVAGYAATFVVQDADGIRVVANTDDTIRVIDKVTATAGYIESTTIGSTVTLVSVNAVEWYATSINGVWTDGTFTYDDTSLTTP